MTSSTVTTSARPLKTVTAWDGPTRLFHWLLAAAVLSAWISCRFSEVIGDNRLVWHRWNGMSILVLLTWRVIWGFAGSSTSRFASFVKGPAEAIRYARDLASGRDRAYLGHNPLGTLMVLTLMSITIVQGTLGLFTVEHNDLTAGPLYNLLSEESLKQVARWHRWLFYWVLIPLVAAHVTANALYGLLKNDPLIPAMITGRKPARAYEDAAEAQLPARPWLRALVCLVAAKMIVFGGIVALGGRLF